MESVKVATGPFLTHLHRAISSRRSLTNPSSKANQRMAFLMALKVGSS